MSDTQRQQAFKAFLQQHRLPDAYLETAARWFDPLAHALAEAAGDGVILVGVNGSQGSGKSTLCDYLQLALQQDYQLRSVALSLDDVYHTRATRQQLAQDIHPLLATRGVPGTHDIALLQQTLHTLLDGSTCPIPRFDKGVDDRKPESEWDQLQEPVNLVILEGWCMGVGPQAEAELAHPVNALEREEDADGRWRGHVNRAIETDYLPLYQQVDRWVMLQAPSFQCVFDWRLEQEEKLRAHGGGSQVMDASAIARFIQFYQRLTEHGLRTLPASVDYLYQLDEKRQICAARGLPREG